MGRRGPGEGSIRKLQDRDLWQVRVPLPDGGRKSLYAKSQAEARRKLTEALRNLDRGAALPRDERQTLAAYLADWLAGKQTSLRSPRTYDRYEELVRLHIVPRIGKRPLARLGPADVERLQAGMLGECDADGQAAYSPATVQRVRTCLHGALKDAERRGLIVRNPCELVDAPYAPRAEMRTWTPEQARNFLAAAEGERLYALFVLALSTGLRQGELFGLRWADVNLERAELRVTYAVQKSKLRGVNLTAEPKTQTARRTIPLITVEGLSAVAVLRAHKARQHEERLCAGPQWEENDLIFCNTLGGPLDQSHVDRRAYAPIVKRARLPYIRFHDLRHTAATNLLAAGVPVEVVSRMLGHADVTTTLRFYRHVRPGEMRQAAEVMGALLGG